MEDEWYYWVELTDDRFFKILRKDLDRKWEDEHAITFYAKNGNIHSFQRRHVLYWKLVSGETSSKMTLSPERSAIVDDIKVRLGGANDH